jgi:hypothetical protein
MLKDIDKTIHINGHIKKAYIERSAFCWRPSWASRFESLWSLLRKFAYLNAATHGEIHSLFRRDDVTRKSLQSKWCLQSDLRHFGGLDPLKLSNIFGTDYRVLAEATVLKYVHEDEAGDLTYNFLRFCPTCIDQGFHSPLHQLLFLTKCPAHGDRLENRCIECLALTIPYKLPSVSSIDQSNCVHLLNGLSQHLTYSNVEELRKEATEREKALLSVAKCLMKRVELKTSEQPLNLWVPQRAQQRCFIRYIRRLPAYWVDAFMSKSRKDSFNISKDVGTHIQVRHHEYSGTSQTSSKCDLKASLPETTFNKLDLELYRIYKAIRRHLYRSYLSYHQRRDVKASKYIWWDRSTLTWQGTICPAANALLFWRMFWEGIDQPHILFRPLFWENPDQPQTLFRYQRLKFNYQQPYKYWELPTFDIPIGILRRIFTLECVGIFHECWLLAIALHRKNLYSFQPGYIKGRRKPYWILENSESGEFTIHWWISRSLASLFARHAPPFERCAGGNPLLTPVHCLS